MFCGILAKGSHRNAEDAIVVAGGGFPCDFLQGKLGTNGIQGAGIANETYCSRKALKALSQGFRNNYKTNCLLEFLKTWSRV